MKISPIRKDEIFVLKQLYKRYGLKTFEKAISFVSEEGNKSFSYFQKILDDLANKGTSFNQKGYQAELELVRKLKRRKEFHTVIRSVGSRSFFDVVAIGKRKIILCQVKSGKGKFKDERKKLRQLKVPRCAKKLFKIYRKGKGNTISIK